MYVPPFSFIRFMGYVSHRGGSNTINDNIYRLLFYCAIDDAFIPTNAFFAGDSDDHERYVRSLLLLKRTLGEEEEEVPQQLNNNKKKKEIKDFK